MAIGMPYKDPELERAYQREWQRQFRKTELGLERSRDAVRTYKAKHLDRLMASRRKWMLKSKFGMTPAQYDAMWEKQNGKCAACGLPLPEYEEVGTRARKPPVDHNHVTGDNRGILHSKCNRATGLVGDNPKLLRQLADYLETHRVIQ